VVSESVIVKSAEGLHARPASEFVRLASLPGHTVFLSKGTSAKVRGDSILGLLSLGVKSGEKLTIEVNGPDEKTLIQSLISIVSGANSR
jgi:phosphocarrier protein HPr